MKFSFNTSNGAVFFFGVSSPGSTSASAPCSSLFQINPRTMPAISGGSLLYQVGLVLLNQRSTLRDAVQANLFHRL